MKILPALVTNYNTGFIVPIRRVHPQGTNSTMSTDCCGVVAINDIEVRCPHCNRLVVGYDANSAHERHQIRWQNATSHWKRK